MRNNAKSRDRAQREATKSAQRPASQQVKDARARLTRGSDIKPEYEHELLTIFARKEMSAAVTMPALSIIFSLASMFWAPAWQAVGWLLLVIGSKVILLEACRRFLLTPHSDVDVLAWRKRFIFIEAINGMTWAGFALVGGGLLASGSENFVFTSHVFIFATLIVVLAIRMTFASTCLTIMHVGTIPMTMAVAGRLVLLNEPFYLALASMAVGVHVYFVFLARGLNSTSLAMIEFRAQKDALIAELEEEKAISEEARRRAETANRAKSRFLATMSHELRTPLNAIMGFSEVMKGELLGPIDNPTYREYAGNIHDSGSHLLKLINEILDLSRIEAGRYDLHEEPIYLADVMEDGRRLLGLRADAKGIQVEEHYSEDLPQIWGDQRAMRQICLNLLSNAIKFTPTGGRVTLSLSQLPAGGQILSVRDTGPGIPADEIPKVLQAFGQGSLAHETAEGGTGLGLPIVKSLIELHGGTFELRSELRKGTEAIIRLPRERVLKPVAPLQPLGQESHRYEILQQTVRSSRQPRLVSTTR